MNRKENNIIIYQDEDGITKVTVRFVDEEANSKSNCRNI